MEVIVYILKIVGTAMLLAPIVCAVCDACAKCVCRRRLEMQVKLAEFQLKCVEMAKKKERKSE